jgi:isopropylmalate/homocitrate/citramalate synthase
VVDTFGGLNPHSVPYLIKKVKERVTDKPIGVHFHDDFGLGAATTIMGLAAGADIAHTSISGIGERSGNTPYEDVAMALLTMYGIDTGLNYEKIYPLSKYLREVTGLTVRQNRGIVGDCVADIESGIVAGWYKNVEGVAPLELSPFLYNLVGHPDTKVVIGKLSGLPTVEIYLDRLGMETEDKDAKMEILKRVKDRALEKHCLLTLEEFGEIAKNVLDKA